MKTKLNWMLIALSLTSCTPKSEAAEPEATSGSEQTCEAKFQARRAYASFKEPPGEHSMATGMLMTEEVMSSLRQTGCLARPDLPMHPTMVDALHNGALIVTAITFLTPELDVTEVIASEATYGDANAPEARSFSIRLRRAHPPKPTSYTAEGIPDEIEVDSWHITGLDQRPAGSP